MSQKTLHFLIRLEKLTNLVVVTYYFNNEILSR